ncbi:MAG: FAD:protein FMN transferase [Alphaproteobacteria bacterium]|nr:MAG: FAD:protein FMN transferase [Alphaproteobacteria bacterium]
MIKRRRLLAIMAATLGSAMLPLPGRAQALTHWRGVALGADASITLAHPEADAIIDLALAEIARLEAIFSLHRPDSALARLNAAGRLEAPPFELLECLGQCAGVHAATGGRFDPTIQPLWALYAEHCAGAAASSPPPAAVLAERLARTGWPRLRFDAGEIRLEPGMALSLNGIAQGYIADRVADLLRGQGLDRVLVNTGEFQAVGGDPRGGPWSIGLRDGDSVLADRVELADGALATSAAHGITFDRAGRLGHILDPRTGLPAARRWRLVTMAAPRAWLADALSTAFCLMDRETIDTALAAFPQTRLERLVPEAAAAL